MHNQERPRFVFQKRIVRSEHIVGKLPVESLSQAKLALAWVTDLIALKISGPENSTLDLAQVAFHAAELARMLMNSLTILEECY